jgi:hypothetical protein
MGNNNATPVPAPCIVIKHYSKDNVLTEVLNVYDRRVEYANGKIPNGKVLPLPEVSYQKLQKLINDCGMHNFEDADRFGDALGPCEYIKLEVDTKAGRKKLHVQLSSYPGIISTFINNVTVLTGLGRKDRKLIDITHPWSKNKLQKLLPPLNPLNTLKK